MPLFNYSVINTRAKPNRKTLVVGFVCALIALAPNLHRAQSFVDEKMLLRLEQEYGTEARQRGVALINLLAELSDKDVTQQLTKVNHFFNQFRYTADIKLWKQKDYWATPEEFIGHNSGDCEDYVVAK